MNHRQCKACGASFQYAGGRGRPPSYCDACRSAHRYGTAHKRLRAQTIESAYGTPCARCGELMWRGQQIHLDHAEDGVTYLGYSHASCNTSAGASKGNRARALKTVLETGRLHVCVEVGCHDGERCACGAHSRPW